MALKNSRRFRRFGRSKSQRTRSRAALAVGRSEGAFDFIASIKRLNSLEIPVKS